MKISPQISIEELVDRFPVSVSILRDHHLICIICGEPVWGTLEELAKSKNLSDEEIEMIIRDIMKAHNPTP